MTADRFLTCSEVLESYADYRDGALQDPRRARSIEAHLGECLRCRRLSKALSRGLALLQDAPPEVELSARFRDRLDDRLRTEIALGNPLVPTHAGLAAALLVATALGLLLVEGVAGRDPGHEVAAAPGPVFQPALSNVTLPAFTHSTLEFHGVHAPLGSFALFQR